MRRLLHFLRLMALGPMILLLGVDGDAGGDKGGDANAGDKGGDKGGDAKGGGDKGGGDKGGGQAKYTDADMDRIAGEREARASKAALKDFLKQKGVTDEAEIDQILKDYRARKDAEKTEAQREKERADKEKERADKAEEAGKRRTATSEIKVLAVKAGVHPDKVDRLVKLVDVDEIEFDKEGEPKPKSVQAAVDAVLKDFPEFKGQAGDKDKKGADDFGGGGGEGTKTDMNAMIRHAAGRR